MVASFFTLFWIHRYFTCKFYFQVLIGSFTCSFMNVSSSRTQSSIRLSCCAAGKTRPIPISRPMPMSLDPDATLALVFQIQCWTYVNQLAISLWSITTIRAVDTAFTMPCHQNQQVKSKSLTIDFEFPSFSRPWYFIGLWLFVFFL